jgi:RHH-type proline utilization regulon transcriptional repressor/proline dehydrogenase/delta 1-pyrroline-5-carboxylate dehydrogenase
VNLGEFQNESTLELRRADIRASLLDALSDLDARLPIEVPVLIGNDRRTGAAIASRDPGEPERLVALAALAGGGDVDAAIASALAAAPSWRARGARQRAEILARAAAAMRAVRFELAALEVRECAKPWLEADADVCEAIDFIEFYARAAIELEAGRKLLQVPGERNTMHFEPRGVTAVISPWNFPIAIPAGMVAAALATGNPVVLKPAEQAPGCALRLVELLLGAGVSRGALGLLPGDGSSGRLLAQHPDVATIAFTGSSAVGHEILGRALETSTRRLKRVVAELGGKNCIIVDEDADLDEAVPALIYSAFGYAGQKCSACSRILAHEAVAEQLATRLKGAVAALSIDRAERFGTDIPPLIEAAAQQRIASASELAEAQGRILARGRGAPPDGWFCDPLIAAELPPDSALLHEELFGPFVSFEPVPDLERACAVVDSLPFALTAGLFSRDPRTIAEVSAALPAGNLYINRSITGAVVGRQPFGGNRLSGIGSKAGGSDYLLQFVEPRVVTENTLRHGLALS